MGHVCPTWLSMTKGHEIDHARTLDRPEVYLTITQWVMVHVPMRYPWVMQVKANRCKEVLWTSTAPYLTHMHEMDQRSIYPWDMHVMPICVQGRSRGPYSTIFGITPRGQYVCKEGPEDLTAPYLTPLGDAWDGQRPSTSWVYPRVPMGHAWT